MELFRQLNPAIVIEFPEGIEGDPTHGIPGPTM
jgi:hypothetical protein